MSDWLIAAYERDLSHPEESWRFYQRKPWSHRIKLRPGRRPLLHDGNFNREPYMRKALKQARREQRRLDKRLLKRDPDAIEDHRAWFCAICGGHH
jgi:hypothetical protein